MDSKKNVTASGETPNTTNIILQNVTKKLSPDITKQSILAVKTKKTRKKRKRLVINPCLDVSRLRDEKNTKQRELTAKNKECENYKYKEIIDQYFKDVNSNKLTHKKLLEGLYKYYNYEKRRDINFKLGFKNCIEMFPRDLATEGTNFKRQHIFEALCRLLLMYNYDNSFGDNKIFHTSLEDLIDNKLTTKSKDDILKSNVNEGSKAGIVDILFMTNINKDKEEDKEEEK